MASNGKLHQVLLVMCLVVSSIVCGRNVEARDSVFFSKVNPVPRYSQLISSSMRALAPLASVEATPAPAPKLAPAPTLVSSEVEPTSENYVYGFYNREVGEFPMATTKEEANAIKKKIETDDEFINNDSGFGSEKTDLYDRRFATYENEYIGSNNREVNRYTDFQKKYRSNNNVHNNKYTRRYDDNKDDMYTTNYNDIEGDNNDRYTDENQYYTDKFERSKARTSGRARFVKNERYYNDNGSAGYYRDNQRASEYNPMEEYEGVYQP